MKLQMLAETFIHSALLTFGQCLSASFTGRKKVYRCVFSCSPSGLFKILSAYEYPALFYDLRWCLTLLSQAN